jgi:chromosomal replication initiator protein
MILVADIKRKVASDFKISLERIEARERVRDVARPRQVAMYLAKKLTPHSLSTIARIFEYHHTNVLHAIRATERRMAADPNLALKIEARKLLLECEPKRILDTRFIGFSA